MRAGRGVSEAITRREGESDLVARARAGDAAAFEEIVVLHRPRLVGLCTQWLNGDRHLAEDIAQEALVRAYRHLREDERPLRLRAWLDTTARNACIDEHRRHRAVPMAELPDAPADGDGEPRLPDTSLRRAWGRLEDRQRTALRLRELDGRSYREIAAVLGITLAATQGLIWRARSALRREYGRVGGSLALSPAVARIETFVQHDVVGRLSGSGTAVSAAATSAWPSLGVPLGIALPGGAQQLGHRLLSVLGAYLPGSMESALAGLVALVLSIAPFMAPVLQEPGPVADPSARVPVPAVAVPTEEVGLPEAAEAAETAEAAEAAEAPEPVPSAVAVEPVATVPPVEHASPSPPPDHRPVRELVEKLAPPVTEPALGLAREVLDTAKGLLPGRRYTP